MYSSLWTWIHFTHRWAHSSSPNSGPILIWSWNCFSLWSSTFSLASSPSDPWPQVHSRDLTPRVLNSPLGLGQPCPNPHSSEISEKLSQSLALLSKRSIIPTSAPWLEWCQSPPTKPFLQVSTPPSDPGGSGDRVCLQCGRPGFDPWVGKIPWRRKWQPTPVFLPVKSHGQKSLVGYTPWGCKVRHNWATNTFTFPHPSGFTQIPPPQQTSSEVVPAHPVPILSWPVTPRTLSCSASLQAHPRQRTRPFGRAVSPRKRSHSPA